MHDLDAPLVAPARPPREWFESVPEWFDPNGSLIQVDFDSGRVAALVAPYGECILDGTKNCWSPPVSKTNYEYAHVGTMVTEDGDQIRVANVGGSVPHASLHAAASVAQDHYANTATRRMVGRYVDAPDHGGIVFLGSMWPGTSQRDGLEVMASALSGDWRWIQSLNDYEMVGSQLVNNPGFRPVPGRTKVAAAFGVTMYQPKVASVGEVTAEQVVGEWMVDQPLNLQVADRLGRIASAVADLLVDGYDDDVDGDPFDHVDVYAQLGDDECLSCLGVGCRRCMYVGYFQNDIDEALIVDAKVAATKTRAKRALRDVAEAAGDVAQGGRRGRGGVGGKGGFYKNVRGIEVWHDPGTGRFAEKGSVTTRALKSLNRGDVKAFTELRTKADKQFKSGIDLPSFTKAVLGDRPASDTEAQLGWDRGRREIARIFQTKGGKTKGVPTPEMTPRERRQRVQNALRSDFGSFGPGTQDLLDRPVRVRPPENDDFTPARLPKPTQESVTIQTRDMRQRAAVLPPAENAPARRRYLEALLWDAHKSDLTTDAIHDRLGPSGDEYDKDRYMRQRGIVDSIMEQVRGGNVPRERRALMIGGLPASGKSTLLDDPSVMGEMNIVPFKPGRDMPEGATHVVINSDDVKELMAQNGMNPNIGLKPMEEATLMHVESAAIAQMLEEELTAEGYNVVFDGWMGSDKFTREQVGRLQDNGYKDLDGMFVDISVEESRLSAASRYEADAMSEMGGRFIPDSVFAQVDDPERIYQSRNRAVFEGLAGEGIFQRGVIVNNDGVSRRDADGNATPNRKVMARIENGEVDRLIDDTQPAGEPMTVAQVKMLPGITGGSGTENDPFVVTDMDTAAMILAEGGYRIQLERPDEIVTLLDKLAGLVNAKTPPGEKPDAIDLCRVTVPGTNLFCAKHVGWKRVQMPQFASPDAVKDSVADMIPRGVMDDGTPSWPDVLPLFLNHQESRGIPVNRDTSRAASRLHASQMELDANKTRKIRDGIAEKMAAGSNPFEGSLIVTEDGYVVDGHHRWAGMVAYGLGEKGDVDIPVQTIDMPIPVVLDEAVVFTSAMGIPPADPNGNSDLTFAQVRNSASRMSVETIRRYLDDFDTMVPDEARVEAARRGVDVQMMPVVREILEQVLAEKLREAG